MRKSGRLNDVPAIYFSARKTVGTHTNYFKTIHKLTAKSFSLLSLTICSASSPVYDPLNGKKTPAICSTPRTENKSNLVFFNYNCSSPQRTRQMHLQSNVHKHHHKSAILNTSSQRKVVRGFHTVLSRIRYLGTSLRYDLLRSLCSDDFFSWFRSPDLFSDAMSSRSQASQRHSFISDSTLGKPVKHLNAATGIRECRFGVYCGCRLR